MNYRLLLSCLVLAPVMPVAAQTLVHDQPLPPQPLLPAPDSRPLYNNYGGVGLLVTPTARFAPDGEASLFLSDGNPYRLLGFGVQILPGVEATARYALVKTVPLGTGTDYVDKGVDLKFRLWQEDGLLPQVALGFRDLAGTGLFGSEYVVASKRLGSVDLSLGLGWGNLGARGDIANPLCSAATRFCEREAGFSGRGGQVETGKFFAGRMGVFGGVAWQTAWQPLRLVAELDGNDYRRELVAGDLQQRLPVNLGAVFSLSDSMDLRLGHERGDAFSLTLSVHGNLHRLRQAKLAAPETPWGPPGARPESWPAVSARLKREAGYDVERLVQADGTLTVVGEQQGYRNQAMARERAWRVLQAATPAESVTDFRIADTLRGRVVREHQVNRDALSQAYTPSDEQPTLADITASTLRDDMPAGALLSEPAGHARFQLSPYLQQYLGGIDNFYFYDLGLRAGLRQRLAHGLELQAGVQASVVNNFDGFQSPPDTAALPPVRTLIREYLRQPVRLERLQITQVTAPGRDWLATAYAGYLELMFAGAGGEVLYRPNGQGWGLGLDMNVVRQRDPRHETGLLPYQVVTGHATAYLPLPDWHNTLVKLSAGRFLAGDTGLMADVSRRFDSGMVVGAYAAKTNVSAAEFGEGSFNKGIYVVLPLDLFSVRHTRSVGVIGWNPIQRDGGQMLNRGISLWQLSEARIAP